MPHLHLINLVGPWPGCSLQLLALLAAFGQNDDGDCDGDGDTDVNDVLYPINAWGDCP